MISIPSSTYPLYSEDRYINLYYLNRLYQCVADSVSLQMREKHGLDIPLTSGIWGGTYLITDEKGQCKNRPQRLYFIVNLPQDSPLDDKDHLNNFMKIYQQTLAQAFQPHGISLHPESWGDPLPYSNISKPSMIMHCSEKNQQIRWLRAFFIWNYVPWEESVIHDTIRNIKVLKELLNINTRPVKKTADELKFLMQDVIITYRTLERALSEDFIEHAKPIIEELTGHYLAGLHDPDLIWELYLKVFSNGLVYGFEETLEEYFGRAGLDIHQAQNWAVDKINWVPEDLKEKLIPPIKELFLGFEKNLQKDLH